MGWGLDTSRSLWFPRHEGNLRWEETYRGFIIELESETECHPFSEIEWGVRQFKALLVASRLAGEEW
jgi:hypothetical protein